MDVLKGEIRSSDWQKKNNVDADALELANQKMARKISPATERAVNQKETVVVNGKVLHKRSEEDYNDIYSAFKEQAEEKFRAILGYGSEVIEKIGIKHFIDAYDWRDATDIFSFETDLLHIIPCAHCGQEFTDFEQSYGLCDECKNLYDLEKFEQVMFGVVNDVNAKLPEGESVKGLSTQCIAEFIFDTDFRRKFLVDKSTEVSAEPLGNLTHKWDKESPEYRGDDDEN